MLLCAHETRTARLRAACALFATCVLIPAASAQQAATNGTASQQTAAAKPDAQSHSTTTKSSTKKSSTASASATHASAGHRSTRRKRTARVRGQKKIDPDRARTIQEALIREHYLSGEPTGTWNQASEDAMRRYQSDHGWQTKEVPDSRALISLGLGPSKDHLLNPESAMTTSPPAATLPAPAPSVPPPASAPTPTPTPTPTPSDSPGPQ